MNILLIGYGKMGKAIEQIALQRNHQIIGKINQNNRKDLPNFTPAQIDVAIEFTQPEAVVENLITCFQNNIPVVCGTTGWLSQKNLVENLCQTYKGSFLYASNFSIGVNLFFRLNIFLAQLMSSFKQYDVSLEEIHHTEKKDAPSGTAITLAENILQYYPHKTKWVNAPSEELSELSIISRREANVPGTHVVSYRSTVDSIEIKHTAHNRMGFALGAVLAAEWLQGKQGIFTMQDVLKNISF
ncbi:MAG: 4-hydroxy-tetrahydrodipicolinate reductase [Microscillaceae bacterium]|nr:4-hydroxy-tetrahydrodipicolinate reductase [Microscillaceae bacterium]MDW8460137.1 4-hydroxy-tetrahydrodipicolinate reductase [Cytophagales bacterium]